MVRLFLGLFRVALSPPHGPLGSDVLDEGPHQLPLPSDGRRGAGSLGSGRGDQRLVPAAESVAEAVLGGALCAAAVSSDAEAARIRVCGSGNGYGNGLRGIFQRSSSEPSGGERKGNILGFLLYKD